MTRLLVTGASGLLGGCVLRRADAAWNALGTCHSRPGEGLVPLDIRDADAVMRLVREEGVTHVIHAAAIRSPDACLADPDLARAVNVDGSRHLAGAAQAAGAHFLYVSTDYVFPGVEPPYREDDPPDPVNLYGRTKLGGEGAAAAVDRHTVVRIPALYRIDLDDARSYVTELAAAFGRGETLRLDAETVRYYTLADDVADAMLFLLETDAAGVVHLSATERTTKAAFARAVARRLGYGPGVVEDGPRPAAGDERPHDSHLATDRYDALGGPPLRPFGDVLPDLG